MIIKVILLVVLAALGYKMWIPPHPTPLQQERDKYGKESFLDRIVRARWALWATAVRGLCSRPVTHWGHCGIDEVLLSFIRLR